MRTFFRHSLTVSAALLYVLVGSQVNADPPPDYAIQAAWMRLSAPNFEWPDKASDIRVCVYGKSEMIDSASLQKLYSLPPSPTVKLSLVGIDDWKSTAKRCKILFIHRSEEKKIPEIVAALKSAPVLTVSNSGGFASEGGMIEFTTEGATQRYIINPGSIKEAGIGITDPKILDLAKEVK